MRTAAIREALGAEHARLEARLQELADAAETANAQAMVEVWRTFESALREHLAREERDLLPAVEHRHAREVARVRKGHATIRAKLDELGIQVELHTVRREMIDGFIALLRGHAAHEDATVYRAADEELGPKARMAFVSPG